MHIANIEKLPLTTTGSPLLIRCKTFLSVTFVIPKDSECHDVFTSLLKLYQPGTILIFYYFIMQTNKVIITLLILLSLQFPLINYIVSIINPPKMIFPKMLVGIILNWKMNLNVCVYQMTLGLCVI